MLVMVQTMEWTYLVQQLVWGKMVVYDMVAVVIGGFGNFEKIDACFVAPLIATQS